MSYHHHAQIYSPAPQRPVVYRTRQPILRRLLFALAALLVVVALACGAALLVMRLQVTQAQLDNAHLQGMAVGQTMCSH